MYNASSDIASGAPGQGYPPSQPARHYPPQPARDYPQQLAPDYLQQPAHSYAPQQQAGYPAPQQQAGYPAPQQAGYPAPQHMTNQTSNTTVIVQQPQEAVVVKGSEQWSSGLFDICADCGLCFLGVCCPSCLAGQVASKAGEWYCVGSSCPVALRSSIRTRYNIEGSVLKDACTMTFCPLCAYCQMGREQNIRGGR